MENAQDSALESTAYAFLVAGANRGEATAQIAVIEELRPWLLAVLFERFSHLEAGHAEMLADAERTLVRWLCDGGRVHANEAPARLARRLLSQEGKRWQRSQRKQERAERALRDQGRALRATERARQAGRLESVFDLTCAEATSALSRLGEPHRSVILVQVGHVLGGGPSVGERFNSSAATARKRLQRAREALMEKAKMMIEDDEDSALTHTEQAMAYYGGDLTPEEMVAFEHHLEGCSECEVLLDRAVVLLPMAEAILAVESGILTSPAERIREFDRRDQARRRWRKAVGAAAGVSLVLASLAGARALRQHPPPPAAVAPTVPQPVPATPESDLPIAAPRTSE